MVENFSSYLQLLHCTCKPFFPEHGEHGHTHLHAKAYMRGWKTSQKEVCSVFISFVLFQLAAFIFREYLAIPTII